jgi:branched-chain amino acid transport system permease protein
MARSTQTLPSRPITGELPATGISRDALLKAAGWLLLLVAALAIPFVTADYRTYQFTLLAIYAVIVLGLNILTGYAGQISLAHGAFVLVGAYLTGMLLTGTIYDLTLHPVLAVLASGVVAALVGVLIGIPALRLHGPYLAVVTLGLAIAMPIILKSKYLDDYTLGAHGILVQKPMPPDGFFAQNLFPAEWQYFVMLLPAALMIYLAWNIRRSRVGRAFIALRDSEAGAQMAGVNTSMYKVMAFAVSAFYAGIGGGMLVLMIGFVSPDTFGLIDSINFLTAMVIGGLGSILGAVLGGAFLAFQGEINTRLAEITPQGQNLRGAVFGVLLILLIVFAPGGIVGIIRRPPLVGWLRGRLRGRTGPSLQSITKPGGAGMAAETRETEETPEARR